jgi:hypothetical protein
LLRQPPVRLHPHTHRQAPKPLHFGQLTAKAAYRPPTLSQLDEDIPTVDTTVAPTATLPHVPQF